jgi:hypothetical protein
MFIPLSILAVAHASDGGAIDFDGAYTHLRPGAIAQHHNVFNHTVASAAGPAAFVINTSDVIQPSVNKRTMGCHLDYGFAQAPRGFYAELVYGTSFERGTQASTSWHPFFRNSSKKPVPNLVSSSSFSGNPSLHMQPNSPGETVGMANRGIGNAGLVFEAGKEYEAEAWVWCGAGAGKEPLGFFELADSSTNATLARAEFKLVSTGPPWGTNWFRFNATLVPSASTGCVGIPFGSDPAIDCAGGDGHPAHVCVRCGGEVRFGVVGSSYGGINVGRVSLMPGVWGRVPRKDGSGPTTILKSAGDVLTTMGVTLIRNGGSVSQSMRWKVGEEEFL